MSTFGGIMTEYSHVVIDRFVGAMNMKATAYFLSHAHTDHMVGLGSSTFSERLKQGLPNVHLYCSVVTKLLLLKDDRFQHLEPYIACLPIDQPTTIVTQSQRKDESLIVTLLPAGHCPGSVMFLFEGSNGVVLYTGDFRLSKGDAALMCQLHSGSSIKDIKCIYADTTFCTPMAMHIPSREQSLRCLLDLIDRHISKSEQNQVKLVCKAKYGYEYLFVELSKAFRMKIHVSSYMMMHYQTVPDLAGHMTSDGTSTRIHACAYTKCNVADSVNTIVIKPSTMWFTSHAQPDEILKKVSDTFYRLCYSFHSSYGEIRDFVGYLKPWKVKANVIPMRCTEQEIVNRLSDLLRIPISLPNQSSPADVDPGYKPLGSLKKKRRHKENDASLEYDKLFGESCLRIKKRKSSLTEKNDEVKEMRGVDNVANQRSQCSHDEMDAAISDTGSDKVMQYGWEHFRNGLQDGLSTEGDADQESNPDVDRLQGGNHESTEDNDCDDMHRLKYDVDKSSNKFVQKNVSDSNNKVSDWLQYLPPTFVESANKKLCHKNKSERVGISEPTIKEKNVVEDDKRSSFDKKRSDGKIENLNTVDVIKITGLTEEVIEKKQENLTSVNATTNIEDDSQRTEEYSLLPDHHMKSCVSEGMRTDNVVRLEKQTSEGRTPGRTTTPHTCNNHPSEDNNKSNKLIKSEAELVCLPPKIEVTSDDDSTYVSGQLSQGHSDIPGTPDSKSTMIGSDKKELTISRVYTMANRRSFVDRLKKH